MVISYLTGMQVWNYIFLSISNIYWRGFPEWIAFLGQCDTSLWLCCVLSLKYISCGCEPRGLQWIFNEDFTPLLSSYCSERNIKCIYSVHKGRSESCDCNFNIFAKFPLVTASIISVPSALRCVWHSVTLSAGETFCSALSSPYSQDTVLQCLFFIFSPSPFSRGFFLKGMCDAVKPGVTVSAMLQLLLAGGLLMLLLPSICVFAALTFIQYLSKNWSWACCSWSAEPQRWEGGGSACGGGRVLGGGCGWSTQEWEFWEYSAFKQLADRQANSSSSWRMLIRSPGGPGKSWNKCREHVYLFLILHLWTHE